MVMVTRNAHRKASESFTSEISEKNIKPPWCSSGRAHERRKPRKVVAGTKSFYPLRENIWEYLNDVKAENIAQRTSQIKKKPEIQIQKSSHTTLLVSLFLALVIMAACLTSDKISQVDLITKILPKTNFISLLNIDSTSVGEECCHRMRHLTLALKRTEQALRKALRVHNTALTSQSLETGTKSQTKLKSKSYIMGARAFRGSNTIEWQVQAALWGIVPLWRASPSPDIILSLRRPTPSDCWPMSGSYGDVVIELPRNLQVQLISLEHIYPDTAHSAPKNFTIYGIFLNGTRIKATDGTYVSNKPAKQYFHLGNNNGPLKQVVFRVLSNQGNPKYTCIYRIHLYTNV